MAAWRASLEDLAGSNERAKAHQLVMAQSEQCKESTAMLPLGQINGVCICQQERNEWCIMNSQRHDPVRTNTCLSEVVAGWHEIRNKVCTKYTDCSYAVAADYSLFVALLLSFCRAPNCPDILWLERACLFKCCCAGPADHPVLCPETPTSATACTQKMSWAVLSATLFKTLPAARVKQMLQSIFCGHFVRR